MSRKDAITGKRVQTGHRKKHNRGSSGGGGAWSFKAPKTKREWKPNLRKATVSKAGKVETVKVAMSTYKKLRSGGSVNGFTLVHPKPVN